MAYRSRFSFWEQKAKVENKPESDSSQPQAVTNSGPGTASGPQMTASSAEGSKSNGAMGGLDTPEQESTGSKKVVRVVRRVVRRVVPAGTEERSQLTTSPSAPDAGLTKPKSGGEDKDDISVGLTSLMGRVRTKEHRPRTRTQDQKEDTKEEVKRQEEGEEEKGKAENEEKKSAVEKQEGVSSVAATAALNPVLPKAHPLSPPPGFIPTPKPNPLAPPAGFIPAPKQNPLIPPPGFIPAKMTSPAPPKQNLLVRPPGFIPVTKTDPLAPPAGFIPKPRLFAVKKPEVKETSCFPAVSNGKPSPAAQESSTAKAPELIPSEEDHKRVRKIFTLDGNNSKLVEDPVAILQAAHLAATK
ncbi:hypothetical protein ATANTOWER_028077, partial [Ataeniobius toweri]|nr:hypothetical protein [Ataeniobius toweri]